MANMVLSRRGLLALGASGLATAGLASCGAGGMGSLRADGSGSSAIEACAENVRIIGRCYDEEGTLWLAQSGSGIEFSVTSPSLSLDLVCDPKASKQDDLRPRYAIFVNDELVIDKPLFKAKSASELTLPDAQAPSTVRLVLLSEAKQGGIGVRGISLHERAASLPEPTKEPDLHIGFVGDSITCAYGIEADDASDSFATDEENFLKGYAYLTAQQLGASYDVVSYSGYGVVSGWTSDGTRKDDWLVPPLYDLVAEGHDATWNFAEHPSDVVVVNLGTNDYSYTQNDEERMAEFGQGYAAFLGKVRERNPRALIVCTMGTMGGQELYPYIEQAVSTHVDATGDKRCISYLSDPIDAADGYGAGNHPNEVTHRKMADKLVSVIRGAL